MSLYYDNLTLFDISVLYSYLKQKLSDSVFFDPANSECSYGYWSGCTDGTIHFTLLNHNNKEKILKDMQDEFNTKYSELAKYFNLHVLSTIFGTDLVFEINKQIDLTCLYGLARIEQSI